MGFFNGIDDRNSKSHHHHHSSSKHHSSSGSIFGSGDHKHNSSRSSFFGGLGGDNYKKHSSSRSSFFGFGGSRSSSYYKRSPRGGFVKRMYAQLRRLLRDLIYYMKRHPMKVFVLVIMPLITGGALTGLLARFGIRLPGGMEKMFGGPAGRGGINSYERSTYRSEGPLGGMGGGIGSMLGGMGGVGGALSLAKAFM